MSFKQSLSLPGSQAVSVSSLAYQVFLTRDPCDKARSAQQLSRQWCAGSLGSASCIPLHDGQKSNQNNRQDALQDFPGRPEKPALLLPAQMPRRRNAGSVQNRLALLHAIAHIELNAIDLAVDMVVRFGALMPQRFTDDWISVANDEAKHFMLLNDRLGDFGKCYGDFPAHDGLWQAAYATRHSLDARLAVVPMVLEARGLDVTPGMIEKLQKAGDHSSSDILKIIYEEEVNHVAIGTKWFKKRCKDQGKQAEGYFHHLVQDYFHGSLKPPFNHPARSAADMAREFYEPLAALL